MYNELSKMVGQTVERIEVVKGTWSDNDRVTFVLENGDKVTLHHYQNCCENVGIEECPNLTNVRGLCTKAYESTNHNSDAECGMWTFYRFCVGEHDFEIRWYGESNGYYSVSVSVEYITALPEHCWHDDYED
jgi:hypothetical protein